MVWGWRLAPQKIQEENPLQNFRRDSRLQKVQKDQPPRGSEGIKRINLGGPSLHNSRRSETPQRSIRYHPLQGEESGVLIFWEASFIPEFQEGSSTPEGKWKWPIPIVQQETAIPEGQCDELQKFKREELLQNSQTFKMNTLFHKIRRDQSGWSSRNHPVQNIWQDNLLQKIWRDHQLKNV